MDTCGRRALQWSVAVVAVSSGRSMAADAGTATALPAGEPSTQAKAAQVDSPQSAGTVVVFNRPIITFRSTFLGVPPRERAATARARIVALLERGDGDQVSVERIDRGDVVKIGGALAFVVANEDVQVLTGETLDTATAIAVRALRQVIAETHEARDGRLMLAAAIWAGGATVVYLLLLGALRFVGRAVTRRVLRLADSTAEKVRIGGAEILHRERATGFVRLLLRIGYWGIVLLLTYEWVGFVLGRFPFTRAWGEQLNAFLVTTTVDMLSAVAQAIPDLLIVVVIFVIARAVNGMLRSFFDGVQSGRIEVAWLDADSARPTRRLATIAVWVFAR